jgi:hypothetical protein
MICESILSGALSKMLKTLIHIIHDNFLTERDIDKIVKYKKFFKIARTFLLKFHLHRSILVLGVKRVQGIQ